MQRQKASERDKNATDQYINQSAGDLTNSPPRCKYRRLQDPGHWRQPKRTRHKGESGHHTGLSAQTDREERKIH